MSNEFNPEAFRKAIIKKLPNITCPICGGQSFSVSDSYVALLAQKDFESINIGTMLPCGTIICKKCGHVDLFALSNYGLNSESGKE